MKKITRRILFCFCIILFLISSPLVILYAFGFRYDFTQKKLVQTGIIYLTPNIQNNIKILIDDKEDPNNISVKGIFKKDFVLYNLMPKTYNIKLDKENYHRWEKNLVVAPGLITYAQPMLLPSNPNINLIFNEAGIASWLVSDEFKKIFYLKNDKEKISANIYDLSQKNPNIKTIQIPAVQPYEINAILQNSKIFLAPDGKKIGFVLPQENTRIIIINSAEKNISILADIILNDKAINFHWDDSSQYFLYLNEKKELNSYDIISKKTNKILENILCFSLKDDGIYYLDKNNLFFYRSSINNPNDKQQLSFIPLTDKKTELESSKEKVKILISAKNTLAAITPQKDLFIVDQNGTPINIGNNVETAVFSKDGGNIVFNSFYEIFIYNLNNGEENLITRLSQKISNIGWYSDYSHIWFLTNQTIKNIELDSRPSPNIIDFINIPKMPADIIYTDTNSIYYDQADGGSLSIYQVEIQKP